MLLSEITLPYLFPTGVGGNLCAVHASRISTTLHQKADPSTASCKKLQGCLNPFTAFFGKGNILLYFFFFNYIANLVVRVSFKLNEKFWLDWIGYYLWLLPYCWFCEFIKDLVINMHPEFAFVVIMQIFVNNLFHIYLFQSLSLQELIGQ